MCQLVIIMLQLDFMLVQHSFTGIAAEKRQNFGISGLRCSDFLLLHAVLLLLKKNPQIYISCGETFHDWYKSLSNFNDHPKKDGT